MGVKPGLEGSMNEDWMTSPRKKTIPLWMIEIDTKVFAELVVKKYPFEPKVVYKPDELRNKGQGIEVTKTFYDRNKDVDTEAKATLFEKLKKGAWTVKFVKKKEGEATKKWE